VLTCFITFPSLMIYLLRSISLTQAVHPYAALNQKKEIYSMQIDSECYNPNATAMQAQERKDLREGVRERRRLGKRRERERIGCRRLGDSAAMWRASSASLVLRDGHISMDREHSGDAGIKERLEYMWVKRYYLATRWINLAHVSMAG
jgi:hypothetical protein